MDQMIIQGGRKLKGEVFVHGAKYASLPLLCSTLLAEGEHIFHNLPKLTDVLFVCQILEHLGCTVSWFKHHSLKIKVPVIKQYEIPYELVSKMRASILFLGPLLSKYSQVQVSFPGGCAIGVRPVDYHIKAMESLGAQIQIVKGYIHAQSKNRLKGARIFLEKPSVGATENILMASCLAEGLTVIENAAREPEIIDLIHYLKSMGASILGEGTKTITIEGVSKLEPSEHVIIPDRIEAATLLLAGAITQGEVKVSQLRSKDIKHLTDLLIHIGFKLDIHPNSITIYPTSSWKSADIETGFYPDFPTDLQAQFMALMTLAKGESRIEEKVFENRFMHIPELNRLGADIEFHDSYSTIRGVDQLKGTQVMATDLRASSSLVLAGLAAQGQSVISRVYHLDRGYERLDKKLNELGAEVSRKG